MYKWYALVYVCPVAWLKTTKLCTCLSYFLGFFDNFESLAFLENGKTCVTPKQSNKMLLSIFQRYNDKATIEKKFAILTKSLDKPNSRYMWKTFSTFCEKICGFLDCFLGTKLTTLMHGWSKLRPRQIKLIWMFLGMFAPFRGNAGINLTGYLPPPS